MIIKFDSKNPITLINEDGHEVFNWNPNYTEKKMTAEDRKYIMEQMKINRQRRSDSDVLN